MAPPKHGYEKEMSAHISTIKPPVHYYEKPMYDQLSELKIPKDSYETGLLKHLSGYAPPPDDKYKVPAVCVQLRLFNPILIFVRYFKVPAPSSGYSPPSKDKYLPPDHKMIKLSPPIGDYSATQPNYMQKMKPPHSRYVKIEYSNHYNDRKWCCFLGIYGI